MFQYSNQSNSLTGDWTSGNTTSKLLLDLRGCTILLVSCMQAFKQPFDLRSSCTNFKIDSLTTLYSNSALNLSYKCSRNSECLLTEGNFNEVCRVTVTPPNVPVSETCGFLFKSRYSSWEFLPCNRRDRLWYNLQWVCLLIQQRRRWRSDFYEQRLGQWTGPSNQQDTNMSAS